MMGALVLAPALALALTLQLALAKVLTLTLASFEEDCHHDRANLEGRCSFIAQSVRLSLCISHRARQSPPLSLVCLLTNPHTLANCLAIGKLFRQGVSTAGTIAFRVNLGEIVRPMKRDTVMPSISFRVGVTTCLLACFTHGTGPATPTASNDRSGLTHAHAGARLVLNS